MNINLVKEDIQKHYHQGVSITVYGMRNKVDNYVGYISGIYPNLFTVLVDGDNKSFSYSDVVTKEVVIEYI